MDWKAGLTVPNSSEKNDEKPKTEQLDINKLDGDIKTCGDKVRDLKTKKADKVIALCKVVTCECVMLKCCILQVQIDAAVKELLSLKAAFKESFGIEWGPNVASSLPQANDAKPESSVTNEESLSSQIKECGDKVRDLKAKKAGKVHILH